jgi:hypothetical protein
MCTNSNSDASTAVGQFTRITSALQECELSLTACVAFSVDNTNVNMGKNNSLFTKVTDVNPSCYFVGCPCHMVHNTASKASESFVNVRTNLVNTILTMCTFFESF